MPHSLGGKEEMNKISGSLISCLFMSIWFFDK